MRFPTIQKTKNIRLDKCLAKDTLIRTDNHVFDCSEHYTYQVNFHDGFYRIKVSVFYHIESSIKWLGLIQFYRYNNLGSGSVADDHHHLRHRFWDRNCMSNDIIGSRYWPSNRKTRYYCLKLYKAYSARLINRCLVNVLDTI